VHEMRFSQDGQKLRKRPIHRPVKRKSSAMLVPEGLSSLMGACVWQIAR